MGNKAKSESVPVDYENLTDEEIMAMEEAKLIADDEDLLSIRRLSVSVILMKKLSAKT